MKNAKTEVNELWRELREAINEAYRNNELREERLCLRDYAENIGLA